MATQIKDTPVLYGKAAELFSKAVEDNKHKRVPKADYDRAQEVYKRTSVITQLNNEGSHADSRS